MKHLKRNMLVLTIVLVTLLTAKGEVTRAAPLTCGGWSVVSSPNAGVAYNYLDGVVGISTSNVWAVGNSHATFGGPSQTLIEQWNGTSWSVVSSPSPGSNNNILNAVAAVSASNIWTVGLYFNGVYGQTLIEHWDGMNWSVITSPNPGAAGNGLNGVTVLSANNIWAVGNSFNSKTFSGKTLIEHWDGTKWSISSSPSVGSFINNLGGVVVISPNDIWAVGESLNSISDNARTLIEHWDGVKWSVVSSPNVEAASNNLSGVAAVSSSNIWAVGYYFGSGQTLIQHWNGVIWSIVPSPNVGSEPNLLNGVTRVPGTSDAWTVGFYNSNGTNTLTEFHC